MNGAPRDNLGEVHRSEAGVSLFLVLTLSCFASAEAASIILFFVLVLWVMLSRGRVGKELFILAAPFVFLLLVGSPGVLFYPVPDALKDVWYVGKVIVALAVGFVLSRYFKDLRSALKVVILAGVFAAFIHFFEVVFSWRPGIDFFQLRQHRGIVGYFVTVIALSLLLSFPRSMLRLSRAAYLSFLFICAVSVVLAFSRTYIVSLVLMVVVLRGWASFTPQALAKTSALILGCVVAVILFSGFGESGYHSLSGKFAASFQELAVKEYTDLREINLHWRGYESYRAIGDFLEGGVFQKIFGQGLGATVDLGRYMVLGGSEIRYAPVLHNGYLYVLIKFGVIGLIVYLLFLVYLLKKSSYFGNDLTCPFEYVALSRMVAGFGWVLVFASLVGLGAFSKNMMFSLLVMIGFSVGLRRSGFGWPKT